MKQTMSFDAEESSAPTLEVESSVGFHYRIEEELEKVNIAVEEINHCSRVAHETRALFNDLFKQAKDRLDKIYSTNRKNIEIARPFYEAKEEAIKAKDDFILAAAKYRSSCVHFEEVRENADTAEKAFLQSFQISDKEREGRGQDPEVLINLNKANEKVFEASRLKSEALLEQQQKMETLSNADHKVALLAKDIGKSITRAKLYFESRDSFQQMVDLEMEKVRESVSQLEDSKSRYRATFSRIHVISAEFEQRLGSMTSDLSKFEEVDDIEDLTADYLIEANIEESIMRTLSPDAVSTNSTISSEMEAFENVTKFDELSLEPNEGEDPEIASCSLSFEWMN
ncbi:hypothetical protein CAPTEDRAFT_225889 [Capitella teleta]|uniref:Uncharacterized protein n=1 Tax=Capitella teleta TaxID=283909 RepID=R7V8F6_CAPTE|nr:hypothetical protein CAPTEDRAFT_225889 [Capitella teleta]|eukprot:ELU14834.1 hypothetical protein CAPTEDRAFT_225889 [Capitella teleta]